MPARSGSLRRPLGIFAVIYGLVTGTASLFAFLWSDFDVHPNFKYLSMAIAASSVLAIAWVLLHVVRAAVPACKALGAAVKLWTRSSLSHEAFITTAEELAKPQGSADADGSDRRGGPTVLDSLANQGRMTIVKILSTSASPEHDGAEEIPKILTSLVEVRKDLIGILARLLADLGPKLAMSPPSARVSLREQELLPEISELVVDLLHQEDLTPQLIATTRELIKPEPLGPEHIDDLIKDLPYLDWLGQNADEKARAKRELVEGISRNQILSRGAIGIGGTTYEHRLDIGRFFFPDTSDIQARSDLYLEAVNRFRGSGIQAIVVIEREDQATAMNDLATLLAKFLQVQFVAFHRDPDQRDRVWKARIADLCGRERRVLIIEPFLVSDSLLDDCVEALRDVGATIGGILVVFHEVSTPVEKLRNHELIRKSWGRDTPCGQVMIDLVRSRRHSTISGSK